MEPFAPGPPPLAVEELVRRAQRGDASALEALLRELSPYLGRICGAIALDDGDDALQDALVLVVRHLPTLREPLALRAWARRIAVREARRVANGGRGVPVDGAELARVPVDADPTTASDVRAVLAGLNPEHRAVLVLRHLEGLSEDEVAAVLDIEKGTVKSRANRAKAAFRARWTA